MRRMPHDPAGAVWLELAISLAVVAVAVVVIGGLWAAFG